MEYFCSVLGCPTNSSDDVKLHGFPFDNQSLLPIWIMATNRSNWVPVVKSRICDKHFHSDDYESGNRNNMLKSSACPMIGSSYSQTTQENQVESSNLLQYSSTSDVDYSDIDSDDLPTTPDTCDMNTSDDDSVLNSSLNSNLNEVSGIDDNYLSSFSDVSEVTSALCIDEDSKHDSSPESTQEIDAISMPLSETSINDANDKCAVVSCNENARNQFDNLFFIDFPINNKKLFDSWLKICGCNDKFGPSLKICSIHFNTDDFTTIKVKRDNLLYRQTILKDDTVPTLYLLPNEYSEFARKRKKSIEESEKKEEEKSTSIETCSVRGCEKTSLQDGGNTLFFKFPLENKILLEKWIKNIELPKLFLPENTDRVCSDHFESHHIVKTNSGYELNQHIAPLIKPENPFVLITEDLNQPFQKSHEKFVFSLISEDCLIVKNKKRKSSSSSDEDDETISLDSLEYKMDHSVPEGAFSISTNSVNSTSVNSTPTSTNEDEYVEVELISEENDTSIENTCIAVSNVIDTVTNNVSPKKCASKTERKPMKKNIVQVQNMLVPISKNNGNDQDYIYLDALNGDDAEKFLSFEKKYIINNSRNKLLQELDNLPKGMPDSVCDRDLTEFYGEMLPPYCEPNCRLICYYSIPSPQRLEIFNEFREMHDVTEQNCKLTELIKLRMIKKQDGTFERCVSFHLIMRKEWVKVCQSFFMNTLGIPECRLNAILKPSNYSWFSDKDTATKANLPTQINYVIEPTFVTDFMKQSFALLDKDYNLFVPDTEPDVSLDNVPTEEYKEVFKFIKSIPRVLSTYQRTGELENLHFETSVCTEYMYKTYSEPYIKNQIPPPYTQRQFKKIYNQYMKNFLQMV